MNVRLIIAGLEADIDRNVSFVLTKQFEDLTNPTIVKNSFSKTVQLPATNRNCQLFDHIYRLDHAILDFDASKRVPFELLFNGFVLETGYIKMNEIIRGQYPQYFNIVLYGEIGNIFYNMSEKFMDELNLDFNHIINRQTVIDSWTNEDYRYFLTYSGLYDNFDSDKIFSGIDVNQNPIKGIACGNGVTVILTSKGYLTFENGNLTYHSGLTTFPNELLSPRASIKYDESRQLFVAWDLEAVYYTSNPTSDSWNNNYITGYGNFCDVDMLPSTVGLAPIAILTTEGYVITISEFGGEFINAAQIENWFFVPNVRPRITRYTGGVFIYGAVSTATRVLYFYQTSTTDYRWSQNPFLNYIVDIYSESGVVNFPYFFAAGASFIYYTKKTNSTSLGSWSSSPDYGYAINGFTRKGDYIAFGNNGIIVRMVYESTTDTVSFNQITNNLTGYNIVYMDYDFSNQLYVAGITDSTGKQYIARSDSRLTTWTITRGYYYETSGELEEHERNEFRSYYQRPGIRLKTLFIQILNESGANFNLHADFFSEDNPYWNDTWVIMNRLKGTELPDDHAGNIRSGDGITYSQMVPSNVSQFSFFISYLKAFGLIVIYNKENKTLEVMDKNELFAQKEVIDWTERIDFSKSASIKPISFDFKYGNLRWSDAGSHYENTYKENYNIEYGAYRIDTDYEFDSNEKDLNSNLFTNVVMSQEYNTLFRGRFNDSYANDKVLPALFTKSNDQLDYNESSWHLVFSRGTLNVSTPIRISDDNPDMLDLSLYMWNDNDADYTQISSYPQCVRLVTVGSNSWSLDFGRPAKLYYIVETSYPDNVEIYPRMWEKYIREIYNRENKILTAYIYIDAIDFSTFLFSPFVQINDTFWRVIKIDNFDVQVDKSTKVELLRVYDPNVYGPSIQNPK